MALLAITSSNFCCESHYMQVKLMHWQNFEGKHLKYCFACDGTAENQMHAGQTCALTQIWPAWARIQWIWSVVTNRFYLEHLKSSSELRSCGKLFVSESIFYPDKKTLCSLLILFIQGGHQFWALTPAGEVRRDEACLDHDGGPGPPVPPLLPLFPFFF